MAQELTLKIIAEGKNIKLVTGQVDKLGKEVKDTGNSMKNAGKQQDQFFNKQQKGVIGVANGTKSFSKMQQTIGSGSSGLVGAYATLAANVFAATAMFNALRGAARFDALTQGLEAMGNQSGQTLSVMARGLKEITEGAISTEEAFRSAALGASGGFGAKELGGLAKIAKGASLALGRDLGDAFDRLTRGAIKLEPEILDELGIMVRLDDAVEKYAATLGKSASSLTQMERRQAFMNEILVQGEQKFGGIAEAVDTNPFDRLAGALADLSEKLLSFINNSGVTAFIEILSKNMFALAGAAVLVASTFAKQMLPVLAEGGSRALATAKNLKIASRAAAEQAKSQVAGKRAALSDKTGGKVYKKLVKDLKDGTASTKEFEQAKKSLKATESRLQSQLDLGRINGAKSRKLTKAEIADKNAIIAATKQEIVAVQQLQLAEQGRGAAFVASKTASAGARAQGSASSLLGEMSGKTGLGGFKALPEMLGKAQKSAHRFKLELMSANKVTSATGRVHVPKTAKALATVKAGFFQAGVSAKLFGAALLNAIPVIGQIIFFAGLIGGAISNAMKTKETEALKKAQENLRDVLDSLPGKVEAFERAQLMLSNPALRITQSYSILSGTIDETVKVMDELLKKEKDVADAEQRKRDAQNEFAGFDGGAALTQEDFVGGDSAFGNAGFLTSFYEQQFSGVIKATHRFTEDQLDILGGLVNRPQFQAFSDTMRSGLFPDLAKDFDLAGLIAAGTPATEILDRMAEALRNVQDSTKGIGPSLVGLAEAFKTADIAFSKFFQTGVKKTPYDQIKKNMSEVVNNINKVREELGNDKTASGQFLEMQKETAIGVGAALSGAGSMVGTVLGPDFRAAQKEAIDLGERRAATAARIAEEEQKSNKDVELINKLKGILVERTKAQENAEFNLGKHYTANASAALRQLEILQNQGLTTANIVKKEQSRAKLLKATIMTGEATGIQIDFQNKALEKQNEYLTSQIDYWQLIAEKEPEGSERRAQLNSFIAGLQQQQQKNTENIMSIEERSFQVTKARLAIRTKELAAEKAIASLLRQKTADMAIINEFELQGMKDPLTKFKAEVQAAKDKKKFAIEEANIKMLTLEAETDVIKARYELLALELEKEGKFDLAKKVRDSAGALDTATARQREVLEKTAALAGITMQASITKAFKASLSSANTAQAIEMLSEVTSARAGNAYNAAVKAAGDKAVKELGQPGDTEFITNAIREHAETKAKEPGGEADTAKNNAMKLTGADVFQGIQGGLAELAKLGPEGELVQTAVNGIVNIGVAFKALGESGGSAASKAAAGMAIVSEISNIMAAHSKAKIANIDREIEAEKKRDGKSKASLEKIKAMEKKKEQMARKAFEMSKKMQIASAIINTAGAVIGALNYDPKGIWNIPLAIAVGAMGMAQIAMIQKTSFQGSSSGGGAAAPQSISVGKRNNKVDVSRPATGGEPAFLRGERGIGSNANSFTPGGGAGMRKGYASGGEIMVGEKGPEIIQPTQSGFNVIPNDKIGGGTTNANFTINAIDAAGVEEVLTQQRGNIIQMIRDAAHEHGEEFIEGVNTSSYEAANGSGGDY